MNLNDKWKCINTLENSVLVNKLEIFLKLHSKTKQNFPKYGTQIFTCTSIKNCITVIIIAISGSSNAGIFVNTAAAKMYKIGREFIISETRPDHAITRITITKYYVAPFKTGNILIHYWKPNYFWIFICLQSKNITGNKISTSPKTRLPEDNFLLSFYQSALLVFVTEILFPLKDMR